MNFIGFPSIEGLHNVVKYAAAFPEAIKIPIEYRGKIKLHGTNAGIRILNGEVAAQSRSQIITPNSDNAGFARWLGTCKEYWKGIASDCVVFGEWCGPGIMNGTAINQIPEKIFAVFAVFMSDELVFAPDAIEALLVGRPADVHVLPWEVESFSIDFGLQDSIQVTVPILNAAVEAVEHCDPWVKKVFGIDGIGEGVVYYPLTKQIDVFKNFAFKAKGMKHRAVRTKNAAQVDPEVAASIDEFVTLFVTDARMEQGLAAVGGSIEMKHIRPFLEWGMVDVLKESTAELAASGLTWDQVQKAVQAAIRGWFIERNKKVL